MENAEDQRMLDRLVHTEATRCLLRDCHATLLRATEGQRAHSRFPGHALTPTGVMAIRCKQFHLPDL